MHAKGLPGFLAPAMLLPFYQGKRLETDDKDTDTCPGSHSQTPSLQRTSSYTDSTKTPNQ